MALSIVLTVIGPDRPGIVEALSSAVHKHGANWEESRMARMANRFAGILRVSVDEAKADPLTSALQALATEGLKIIVERASGEEPHSTSRPLRLELVGNDRPGIVRDISQVLAKRGVNIDELVTEVASAPMSGDVLFKATAELRLPSSVSVADLREVLEGLANDLMVDIALDDA